MNHIKGNISRFGSAIQVLSSDIGKYFSSFLITAVAVFYFCLFLFLKIDNSIVINSYVGNKVDLTWLKKDWRCPKVLSTTRSSTSVNSSTNPKCSEVDVLVIRWIRETHFWDWKNCEIRPAYHHHYRYRFLLKFRKLLFWNGKKSTQLD